MTFLKRESVLFDDDKFEKFIQKDKEEKEKEKKERPKSRELESPPTDFLRPVLSRNRSGSSASLSGSPFVARKRV